ncbi:hypothetical protein [Streptomyces sp. NPDC050528]|uniref:hypothetical protein n=1 Tax=Streptomyces sp. NPDC050528 TaxID=3365623 RepID=UPI0037B8E612
MPSPAESDHPVDKSAEEIRSQELAEAEAKLARHQQIVRWLRTLQMVLSLVALATDNPPYRWAVKCAEWAMERFRDSE